jgi:hypothetical protein
LPDRLSLKLVVIVTSPGTTFFLPNIVGDTPYLIFPYHFASPFDIILNNCPKTKVMSWLSPLLKSINYHLLDIIIMQEYLKKTASYLSLEARI